MAGLVLCWNRESEKDRNQLFRRICGTYGENKDLVKGYEGDCGPFRIGKFVRAECREDRNVYEDERFLMVVVGSLLFEKGSWDQSLGRIAEALASERKITEIVRDFDGHFLFLLQEKETEKVFLATDPCGVIATYVYESEDACLVSNSSLSLATALPVSPDPESMAQYLRVGYVHGSDTLFQEIKVLQPATLYEVDTGSDRPRLVPVQEYWTIPEEVAEGMRLEDARDALISTLGPIMKGIDLKNSIIDLTGGYDSRLILSFLYKDGDPRKSLHTYVFGPPDSSEAHCVETTSRNLRIHNRHFSLPEPWPEMMAQYFFKAHRLCDGEENAWIYAPILWAQETKAEHFGCSVTGLGGELYRDFWWLQEMGGIGRKKPAKLDLLVRSRVLQYGHDLDVYTEDWKQRMGGIQDLIVTRFRDTNRVLEGLDTYNTIQIDHLYLREKIRRWASRTISSSNQIIRCINPLLMKDALSISFSIPPRLKRYNRLVRSIVEEVSPSVSRERLLNGTPYQLMRVSNAVRFGPLAEEYAKKLARKISQVLLRRTILLDTSLTYDRSSWFRAAWQEEEVRDLLSHPSMKTGFLYDERLFQRFVQSAQEEGFPFLDQVGNMLSLERTMRTANLAE